MGANPIFMCMHLFYMYLSFVDLIPDGRQCSSESSEDAVDVQGKDSRFLTSIGCFVVVRECYHQSFRQFGK